MRVESEPAERLRTVLAGHPTPHRGPRRALVEVPDTADQPTVRRVVQVPMRPRVAPAATSPPEPDLDEYEVVPIAKEVVPLADEEAAAPGVAATDTGPREALTAVRAFTRRHLQAIGILVVVALVFTTVQLLRARPSEVPLVAPEISSPATAPSAPDSDLSPSAPVLLVVHVTGAVKNPGIVRVPQGSRVNDAIEAAGGITAEAHLGTLNLAALVSDGMQILVASGPDETSTTTGDDGGSPPGEDGGALVNLNTATQAQLESLPGVGPATAGKILAWREEHGKFSKVEELQEIDGIGVKTFERLKPLVTV